MPESQDIFEQYLGAPVTAQCYKELGQKIKQCSQPERERLLESFQPKELHLQLLKLTIARTSGYHRPLLDGLQDECKFVSEFSLKSRLLYCSGNTELLDVNFLIPLLQTVSLSTRNRVLWNLGKCITTGVNSQVSVPDIFDTLYNAVAKVWGSRVAQPLLCQTSKELLERELPNVTSLSNCHLFVLAKRFPYLALSFLEQPSCNNPPRKAARYIVSKTIPKSFDYIVKQDKSFLTKSTMKFILKNHTNVVLESPSSWVNVLNKHTVKKFLRPDHFELFLTKQFLEMENMSIPYKLRPYFNLLSPSEVSVILNKVFPEKYGCSLRSKLDFWEKNTELLKLLDASDRSFIAEGLDSKDKLSTDWLPLMTTDLSIPRIKTLLYTEQDAHGRTRLVSQLIETAMLNKDQNAIEDICNLVINRYRNDKGVLRSFFTSKINFSSLSAETFDVVLAAAKKFYNPNDWQTDDAAKLFLIGIKRNWGVAALHEFLELVMKNSSYLSISELDDLETDLRLPCVNEVFTTANIENKENIRTIAKFLQLITKWTAKSSLSLINDNVKKCVLTLLTSDIDRRQAILFVCANLNSLSLEFIEECFQIVPNSKLMAYLFSKNSHILKSEETCKRVGKHIFECGVGDFVSLLKKLRKLGHMEILQYLSTQSKSEIADINVLNCRNAVILLMLTSDPDDFFSVIDPLLPSIANNKEASNAGGDSSRQGRYCPLKACKREDSIYYGIGLSISHLRLPSMAIDRLYRFCVSGDLVLFVRDAVYSVSSFLPNEAAKTMLVTLMQQPVSVKKHALRLLWRAVCNIETQEVLLLQLMESEEHLSMRIILINTAISSLNICKYVSMWQVVREILIKLTPDDKTIVLELIYKRVPDRFMEEYLHILLEKCKTLKDVDNASVLCNVLQQVSHFVTVMSQKFIESLIVEYFLAERFFKNVYSHTSISELVLEYLQGTPATSLPVNQILKEGEELEPHRNLGSRQQFLKERLDACAVDSPYDVFDAKQGCYPVRRLLMHFIESFCRGSRVVGANANPARRHDLSEYIDFLLSYFDQFNQNAIFWPYIYLCLIKIMNANASESAFVLGQKVGELCDSLALKSTVALFCYLPIAVAKFFNTLVVLNSSYATRQVIDILRGILATVPASPASESSQQDVHLLRLMTVAHVLPSHWVVSDDYMDFRQTFLFQIKNTPAEVFLFNAR